MHSKRLTLAVGIAVVVVACTTNGLPASGDDPVGNDTASTPTTEVVATAGPQQVPVTTTSTTTTAPTAPTAPSVADEEGPVATTTVPVQASTTTTAPATDDIEEILDVIDDLLSDLDGQLDGLDADLAEVAASLNADEGDIGQ